MKFSIKKLNAKQITVLAVVAVFILVLLAWGTLSVVKHEDPISAVGDIFRDEDELLGNWQGEKGINAYVFYDNGTYESYISTFSIKGLYTVNGNRITLTSSGADGTVVYKYKIKGDQLILTLVSSNGEEPDDDEQHVFTKVDQLNMKTLTEALQDFADEIQANPDEETTEDNN